MVEFMIVSVESKETLIPAPLRLAVLLVILEDKILIVLAAPRKIPAP